MQELIWGYISFREDHLKDEVIRQWYLHRAKVYCQKHRMLYWVMYLLDKLICVQSGQEKKILFWGSRFADLIYEMDRKKILISTCGMKDRIFAIQNRISGIPLANIAYEFYQDPENAERNAILIEKIGTVLHKYSVEQVIFSNDSLPLERLVILACREYGVNTVLVQDGLFQMKSPIMGQMAHGWFADKLVVWGEYFRDQYISLGRRALDIFVLGYPYKLPNIPGVQYNGNRVVCFFSSAYYLYSKEKHEVQMELIKKIKRECDKKGICFVCKLHPLEKDIRYEYIKHEISVVDIGLAEALERYDMFFSITSTALLEVSLCGKIGVQVRTLALGNDIDNYGELGISYSINDDEVEISHCIDRYIAKRLSNLKNERYAKVYNNTNMDMHTYLVSMKNS